MHHVHLRYLGGYNECMINFQMCNVLLLHFPPHGLTTYEAARQAYETWSAQCEQQSVRPFQAFTGERPPKQRKITTLVHQKKVQEIAPGSARTRIMRSSMKLPEAKTWANCSPSTGYAAYRPHHHFKVWLQYYCQIPHFQPGTRCQRPRCAAVMDTYGDHLLYCERGPHRIWRHDAQVKLLARDLAKAARHPVVEERPVGRHKERPDIRALGRSGGTELFDDTICHPLSQARIRDVVENPLNLLKAAWTAKVSRYASMLQAAGTGFNLLPVPLSTLGGWHPDAHKALCSVASTNAARGLPTFSRARSILFQRHASLLETNNALCLISGMLSDIWGGAQFVRSTKQ